MAYQVGYLTDLRTMDAVALDDGEELVSTFQAMPYGTYEHPVHGTIQLTYEKAVEVANNVNNKVRGTDLDIDYDHKQYGGEAAGWVDKAEARQDGLYLTVRWTKKAWGLIKEKAYRYFSPEFTDEWKHPKTGVVHKNVLFGGGITNRPFLKDILPLNMSELSFGEQQEKEGESGMDPKELRKKLGLPEDATDDQVNERIDALAAAEDGGGGDGGNGGGEDDPPNEDGEEGDQSGVEEPTAVAASEGAIGEVIRLAEKSNDPTVKALAEVVQGLQKQVVVQGTALQLAEVNAQVTKLMEPVGNRQLPAGVKKQLSDALLDPSTKNVVALMEAINKAGFVQLGEDGGAGNHGEQDGTETMSKIDKAVKALMEKDKDLSYGDAVEQVMLQDPDLYESHRQGSYQFHE